MKKLTILIAMLIAFGGYSKEAPLNQLVERNGLNYEINSQTPFTGSAVFYHDNGQLYYKSNWKDGNQDGLWETYYRNGQLQFKTNYKNGEEID